MPETLVPAHIELVFVARLYAGNSALTLKTCFAQISRCRATNDGDAEVVEGFTRIRAGKEEKICSGYAGKTLLLNKALSGLSPVKFRVLHKESSENS